MSPLIGIAINLLPEIAKRLAPGSDAGTRDMVVDIVKTVLNTDDPAEAEKRARDATLSAELRLKLAELEATAEAREKEAEAAARQAQVDLVRAELDAAAKQRADEMRRLEAIVSDKQSARETMVGLQKERSPLAWGPVVVSFIVVTGFFATLLYLIQLIRSGLGDSPNPSDQMVLQIVNIAVGALTAGFATVVSFWLGSSDGSRRKDETAFQAQSAVAQMQRDSAAATRDIVAEQTRHTAEIIEKVSRQQPAPPAPVAAPIQAAPAKTKDARQFMKCVEHILVNEGGYVDHPQDPGGATNLGITHKTLAAWRGQPVTKDDVRNLTRDEACEIYRANYWNALNCDNMPAGVDLVVFDFGVNAGVGRSAKLLQKIVHVEQDGQVGPITIGAVNAIDARFVINAFSDGRMDHYRSLRHWETFKNGWTRRTTEIRSAALEMA